MGLVFVLACITVNIYFPEATVKQAAAEIVDEIRKTDAAKKAPEAVASAAGPPRVLALLPRPRRLRPTGDDGLDAGDPGPQGLDEGALRRLKPYFDSRQRRRDEQGPARGPRRGRPQPPGQGRPEEPGQGRERRPDEALRRGGQGPEHRGQPDREDPEDLRRRVGSRAPRPGWWVQQEDGSWVKKS